LKILIVGPSWVGDMVMAQSLFKSLQDLYPGAQIHVLAPGWSRPIIDAMPEVSETLDMPLGHGAFAFGVRRSLGHALRTSGYDWAIVLPNSWKSALIPWFAKIPRRTGWLGEMRYGLLNDVRKLDKTVFPLMVQKYVGLAHDANVTPNEFDCPAPKLVPKKSNIDAAVQRFGLTLAQPILALCPGAEFGRARNGLSGIMRRLPGASLNPAGRCGCLVRRMIGLPVRRFVLTCAKLPRKIQSRNSPGKRRCRTRWLYYLSCIVWWRMIPD